MCGRYIIYTDEEIAEMNKIINDVELRFGKEAVKTGEIFPTDNAPVYAAEKGRLCASLMTWGLPNFKGGVIINARAETAFEKKMFASSLRTRRCVIPSTGFFEWAKIEGTAKKEKYLFNLPDDRMVYMAGFFSLSSEGLPRYVILTTAANKSMRDVHDRMPVILKKNELEYYINDISAAAEFLNRIQPELAKQKV